MRVKGVGQGWGSEFDCILHRIVIQPYYLIVLLAEILYGFLSIIFLSDTVL